MKKIVAIIAGDPESISTELIAKAWKKKNLYKNINVFIIGNFKLIVKQLNLLKIKIKIKKISDLEDKNYKKSLLIYDVPLNFKKPYKINIKNKSKYVIECIKIAIKFSKQKKIQGFINCPINKKDIFNSNFGLTEFLARNSNVLGKEAMIIYNKKLSVCPITTHIKIKNISKGLSKKRIYEKIITINKFYLNNFGFKPNICVLGLNPHNYELRSDSEEKKIILPTIIKLRKKGIKVNGPIPADTAFNQRKKFDILVGMYHDQVLSPFKALFNFDAINITAGLPYLRISPDHGTGVDIIRKNLANPFSLIESIKFFKHINV
ncbi:MAG: hypothetical protein CBD56_01300 [Candidatus Pelagibacter sp. TMED196]|nr:MAG: hypothetical protein CBD56_01300 [Candidatus Pelagibacter sp. TMED196]|tara:strand:+ start:843 stop:1802 length:960 start_codon:yes stop_codon:yes gene_type:complete